ncbi:MAG: DUF6036 family nucleotidyltransferase [Lachnospiraceae bacterium]|nr:DUF6036 family nucleotidyltransferase [Lachnospiraceae bacterium]
MSADNSIVFTKRNIDLYLNEVAKDYKKHGGKNVPVEIVLIGGAAVIERYGFREMTRDIDAVLPAISILKEAINRVGDKYGLERGWLNMDFAKTDSYSPRLVQCSVPYKSFCQVLHVRMVTGEYLIAMKLRSGRRYKKDISDIVGILKEHEMMGNPISMGMIDTAVKNLYGGWDCFPETAVSFINEALEAEDYNILFEKVVESEKLAKDHLQAFQKSYPGVLNSENVNRILERRADSDHRPSVLDKLHEKQRKQSEMKDAQPQQKKKNISRDER